MAKATPRRIPAPLICSLPLASPTGPSRSTRVKSNRRNDQKTCGPPSLRLMRCHAHSGLPLAPTPAHCRFISGTTKFDRRLLAGRHLGSGQGAAGQADMGGPVPEDQRYPLDGGFESGSKLDRGGIRRALLRNRRTSVSLCRSAAMRLGGLPRKSEIASHLAYERARTPRARWWIYSSTSNLHARPDVLAWIGWHVDRGLQRLACTSRFQSRAYRSRQHRAAMDTLSLDDAAIGRAQYPRSPARVPPKVAPRRPAWRQ